MRGVVIFAKGTNSGGGEIEFRPKSDFFPTFFNEQLSVNN